ncbi:MAG: hypothetical protein Q4C68_03010 [Moraxella sp.]|nr:hypothetical protein [Moraxella sp.]
MFKQVTIAMLLGMLGVSSAYANQSSLEAQCRKLIKDVELMTAYTIPCEQNGAYLDSIEDKVFKKIEPLAKQCESNLPKATFDSLVQQVQAELKPEFDKLGKQLEADDAYHEAYCKSSRVHLDELIKSY